MNSRLKTSNSTFYFLFVSLIAFASCDNSMRETPSGLRYTMLREGVGEVVKNREHLVLNMTYKDVNDSVWFESDQFDPVVVKKPASVGYSRPLVQHMFYDLKLGDSITFSTTVADFFKSSYGSPIPPNYTGEEELIFNVGVEYVLNQSNFERWKEGMVEKRQVIIDSIAAETLKVQKEVINDYLDSAGIEARTHESGFSYVINEEGDGPYPINNDIVRVNYTGRVLNGDYFDSSIRSEAKKLGVYDSLREPYDPIEFVLGRRDVIQGWDKSIPFLKEGSKSTIYIPSPLGYGEMGRGDVIPPNSILVFEIELVEVKQR